MHTWHWQTWNDLPYLTCSLLEPWAHGFFTQQFWSRSPAQLTKILQPEATPYRVKQVHGNLVLATSAAAIDPITPADEEITFPQADGLLTEQPQQAAWVCSADCTPVLIGDVATGQVAAIHAGWRGTALKIVPQAIAQMQSQGSRLPDLRIALGPAITGTVYQVAESVALEVVSTIHVAAADLDGVRQLPNSPVLEDSELGRVRLDVRRVNALQLDQMGIQPEQVAIAPHCTFQEPELFFSYRRTNEKKVQWSGIISRTVNTSSPN
jgi:hypothetical protein